MRSQQDCPARLVMAGLLVSLVAGLPAASGCGGDRGPARDAWLGSVHTRPADTARDPAGEDEDRPMTAAQAGAALDRALEQGRHADALVHASRLAAAGGTLDEARRARVLEAVDAASGAALARIWPRLAPGLPPAAHVALRLALWAAHVGDDQAALGWLDRCEQAGADPAVLDRARRLRAALEAGHAVDPAVIAVLLPLSGRFARLGREMRVAIELAAQAHGDARLVFLDTAGEVTRAVSAVEAAVHGHRAVAVLGPVGAQESRAAAVRAAELSVPIALLAPATGTDSGADAAAGVFRLWSPAAWEAREAARLAVVTGHTRLAVLAPRDEHGRRAAEAFAREAARLGVALVAAGHYDPTGTDLEPDIRAFLGLDPATNERLRSHLRRHGRASGWKTFTPDVPFDLLYIPDEHERAALVVSFLPYFNVELRTQELMDALVLRRKHGGRVPQVVQLLGSSGWHHPGLLVRGGPAVEGALVVDVFAGGDEEDYASEDAAGFARRFRARAGHVPGSIAAQAHDAAALVLAARARIGSRAPRADMARALASARLDAGACGPARVERGGIAREAILLRVEDGAFVLHER